jgi:hypothetical protein
VPWFLYSKSPRKLSCYKENYIILREYIKCILPPFTEVVGPIMNLISGTYDFYERREYAFNVLPEYSIITHTNEGS